MRNLAKLVLHLFFRRIEVEGLADVPRQGPIVFVANHTNALVDPLVLVITLPRRLTLTAKNVLARGRLLGGLMAGLGVVTFHRQDDVGKGAEPRQNLRSLQRCRDILRQGGALFIFPEGISHSDPGLRLFRTGAARIVLDLLEEITDSLKPLVVPVGLLYTEKDRFRSAVWLRYGIPLDVARWRADHPEGGARALTDALRQRVEALTLTYESRRESALLTWAAEVMATRGEMPQPLGWPERPIAEWFRLLERLRDGYRTLQETHPVEVEELSGRVRRYRAELRRLRILPAEVYLPLHRGKALFFLFRELELLLIGAPLALFGALNHLLPYGIVKKIAHLLSKDKDHWATNVVYPSFIVFPLCYLLQLGAAWYWLPVFWATVYTIALPYTGYVALLYGERARATLRRARAFLYFFRHRSKQEELAREGRAILADVWALEKCLHDDSHGSRSPDSGAVGRPTL